MKYDNCEMLNSNTRPNNNIIRNVKKKKIELIDVFIIQTVVCLLVSCGVIISKLF